MSGRERTAPLPEPAEAASLSWPLAARNRLGYLCHNGRVNDGSQAQASRGRKFVVVRQLSHREHPRGNRKHGNSTERGNKMTGRIPTPILRNLLADGSILIEKNCSIDRESADPADVVSLYMRGTRPNPDLIADKLFGNPVRGSNRPGWLLRKTSTCE
jgi:hypothetical protein